MNEREELRASGDEKRTWLETASEQAKIIGHAVPMMILIYFIFHNSQELVMKMKMNLKQNESDYKCFDSSVGSLTYNPFRKL